VARSRIRGRPKKRKYPCCFLFGEVSKRVEIKSASQIVPRKMLGGEKADERSYDSE
jgi:hypothetical protein